MSIPEQDIPDVVDEVVSGFDDLPILSRLEFVRNLICSKIDEERGFLTRVVPPDAEPPLTMLMAEGILGDVIRILKATPAVANLREPTPGA